MFSKAEGPTALHADLVRALSFARRQVDVDTDDGPEPAAAALASVWNGKRGFVAVILRFLRRPRVERFVYADSITTESEFGRATQEGLAWAQGLGFDMDPHDYTSLPAEQQVARLKNWNKLRKVRERRANAAPAGAQSSPALDKPPALEQPRAQPPRPTAQPKAPPAKPSRSVLGKIALERRRGGRRWANPIERLLAYF